MSRQASGTTGRFITGDKVEVAPSYLSKQSLGTIPTAKSQESESSCVSHP